MKRFLVLYFMIVYTCLTLAAQNNVKAIIGFNRPLDSLTRVQLLNHMDSSPTNLPVNGFRGYNSIFTDIKFVAVEILHIGSNNFFSFAIDEKGEVQSISKDLLDQIFIRGLNEKSLIKTEEELIKHYIYLLDGDEGFASTHELRGWPKEHKTQLSKLLDSIKSNKKDKTKSILRFSYNSKSRIVYQYEFDPLKNEAWSVPPKRKVLLKNVGPIKYYR